MHSILSTLVLVTILALGHVSAYRPDEVHAEVSSYVRQRSATLLFARGGITSTECFDKYYPLIAAVSEDSKESSTLCIRAAEEARNTEMENLESEREVLNAQVAEIENSLQACTAKTDVLEYMKCLSETADSNKAIIDAVAQKADELTAALEQAYVEIKATEDSCIVASIEKAKEDVDNLFTALQNCLINGEPEETTTPEPEPSTTSEPEPSTTPEPEPSTTPDSESTTPDSGSTTAPVPNPSTNPEEQDEQLPEADL